MTSESLQSVTESILQLFIADPNFKQTIPMKDYHGFEKGRIPSDALREIAAAQGVDPDMLQAEFVSVTQDLSHEVHMHKRARAYCIVLGEAEHVGNPQGASAYLGERGWFPVQAHDVVDIPPNTMHGFTIEPGGVLHFLSVQTPPIETPDGADDYFKADF